jgi:hypothetical protein
MTFQINFPGIGICTASLWHDARPACSHINRQGVYRTIEKDYEEITKATKVSIYFPDDHKETIYGKTYERISVQVIKYPHNETGYRLSWQGHSKKESTQYGDWYLTDAARKVMDERHAAMLFAAAQHLFAALIPHTQKQWLEKFDQEISSERARLDVIENSIKKIKESA